MTTPPALVAVAHGTRDPRGPATVDALLDLVRTLRPDLPVHPAYIEITAPAVQDVVRSLDGPAVVLPLLLSPGYHSTVDIPAAVADRPGTVTAEVLGPDDRLTDALADRLAATDTRPGDAVVLAAAGSSDPAAAEATERQAALLAARTGLRVEAAYLSARKPDLPTAIAGLRAAGARRVTVATYLLAPGVFADAATRAGADRVAAPLGPHEAVARLVLARYDAARVGIPA